MSRRDNVYVAVARNLREFGYSDVTPKMIAEVHDAMLTGKDLPHGIIGIFAKGQLESDEAKAAFLGKGAGKLVSN